MMAACVRGGPLRIIRASALPGPGGDSMASIDKFNDHCWKDVVPEADLKLYASWRRETFVGPQPALLAIDLYDLVYRGGPPSPPQLYDPYPGTCGLPTHPATAPPPTATAAHAGAR